MGPWQSQGVFPVGPASTAVHTEEVSHVSITGHLQWYHAEGDMFLQQNGG